MRKKNTFAWISCESFLNYDYIHGIMLEHFTFHTPSRIWENCVFDLNHQHQQHHRCLCRCRQTRCVFIQNIRLNANQHVSQWIDHTHTHLASDFTSNTFWYRYIFLTELSKSIIKQVRDSMKQWNDSNFDLSALEVNEIFFFFARSVKRCRDDINY